METILIHSDFGTREVKVQDHWLYIPRKGKQRVRGFIFFNEGGMDMFLDASLYPEKDDKGNLVYYKGNNKAFTILTNKN